MHEQKKPEVGRGEKTLNLLPKIWLRQWRGWALLKDRRQHRKKTKYDAESRELYQSLHSYDDINLQRKQAQFVWALPWLRWRGKTGTTVNLQKHRDCSRRCSHRVADASCMLPSRETSFGFARIGWIIATNALIKPSSYALFVLPFLRSPSSPSML